MVKVEVNGKLATDNPRSVVIVLPAGAYNSRPARDLYRMFGRSCWTDGTGTVTICMDPERFATLASLVTSTPDDNEL